MDKLKRFFRRHKKAEPAQDPPAPAQHFKRPRTPGEPDILAADAPQNDYESPRKKSRRDLPPSTLHQLHSRTDSHADSIGSTATAPIPPKLEWAPNPLGGELSGIFEKLSTEPTAARGAGQQHQHQHQQQPQARPYGSMPSRDKAANRHSLSAADLFARGLKRFHEDVPEEEKPVTRIESAQGSEPARSSVAVEDKPATPTEPAVNRAVAKAPMRESMTLDDILNQPLFGDGPPTSNDGQQQKQQTRYFSHLASDGTLTDISPPTPVSKKAVETAPQLDPSKPKRHPLIP